MKDVLPFGASLLL